MRVASLAPSNTEIVAFLGRATDLVAVDDFSDWPPAVQDLEGLGPDLQIDVDRLEDLDLDLVLASGSVPGMEAVVEQVEDRDLESLVLAPESLSEVVEDVHRVATALGVEERGGALADAMADEIDHLREVTREREPVRVYWEWWPDPPIAAGGPGWTSEVIAAAGGENVFGDNEERSPEVTLDAVREEDPEVVALCWQGTLQRVQDPDRVVAREGWDELEAVNQGRILSLPEHLYGRPGPRIVEGIRTLAEELHPELSKELGDPYAWLPAGVGDELPLGGD